MKLLLAILILIFVPSFGFCQIEGEEQVIECKLLEQSPSSLSVDVHVDGDRYNICQKVDKRPVVKKYVYHRNVYKTVYVRDKALSNRVTNLANRFMAQLSRETAARKSSDEALARKIMQETYARSEEDTSLQKKIDNESEAREAGDSDTITFAATLAGILIVGLAAVAFLGRD